jgi:polyphosphate kinase 2
MNEGLIARLFTFYFQSNSIRSELYAISSYRTYESASLKFRGSLLPVHGQELPVIGHDFVWGLRTGASDNAAVWQAAGSFTNGLTLSSSCILIEASYRISLLNPPPNERPMSKQKKNKTKKEESNSDPGQLSETRSSSGEKLPRKEYEKELERLHGELVQLQDWVRREQKKVCILFEGRDGAGKGGVIKALTERVSPRTFRVVALPAPTEREKSQMYIQRYLPHLPAATEIVIFDRSWYNRAGVERVMGFCKEKQVEGFLNVTPKVEQAMVESGIMLLKYWLEVSPEEQTRRLEDRITDGRKLWKLSEMDLKSYARWDEYTRARDEMFAKTHTPWAPWHVAKSDDKRRARLNVIEHILEAIPYEPMAEQKIELPKRKVDLSLGGDYSALLIPETF